jgi:signal transduction histidine kinase
MARRRHTAPVVAIGLGVLAAAIGVAIVPLVIANRAASAASSDIPVAVIAVSFGFVGALVASRQPRNLTGWLFLFVALAIALGGIADEYAVYALLTHRGSLPGGVWAVWLTSWEQVLLFPAGAIALLMLVLPDGRLLSRRWLWVARLAVVLSALGVIGGIFAAGPLATGTPNFPTPQNPLGVEANGPLGIALSLFDAAWLPAFIVFALAAAAPLVRLRRSRGDARQQLKWIAYAVVVSGTAVVLAALGNLFVAHFPNWPGDAALGLGFGVALPAATGVAIFKYRLYDIDIVISRTLVYGSLAVFITAVYVGIAVGIGALVGSGGKPNLALSILATAIVAIGFQPVRERMQKLANRLVYGKRATPYEVLSEFSGRVAETYAADEVLPRMARVLQEGTGAESATVWLRATDELRPAATFPNGVGMQLAVPMCNGTLPALEEATRAVEVRHQGELLGALSVTKRRGEGLTPIEQKLVDDLAHQAGLVLKNVGLSADLQGRLDELRASRQRLVSAQDVERRRLERNLHDGAQQHLVALKVKLGLVELLLARDPEKAAATLEQLKGDADEALETLRDLARGIYPPLLADKGLVVALESQARKATVPVRVESSRVARYAQDVEATVYFCVLEALQNVQKYAGASQVVVRLRAGTDPATLTFEVEDDGTGFEAATARKGAGLTNMNDRVDALGGKVQVISRPGAGTTVSGELPLQEPVAAVP